MPVIKGIQKTTLVDFPGKIAATIFTAGCNFRCGFCHNAALVVDGHGKLPTIPAAEIIEYLKARTEQLEGICVSGGEPTLHAGLPEFIRQLKSLGYAVKLDTNGTNPEMLRALLNENLLDYIAMDIKGPIEMYPQIVNTAVDKEKILESIDLIIKSNIKHEFRTTMLPQLHSDTDVETLGCLLRGAQNYYLQQFRAGETMLDPQYQLSASYSEDKLLELAKKYEPYVSKVKVRGID